MLRKQRKPIPKRREGKPRRVSVPRSDRYLAFLRAFGICPVCGWGGRAGEYETDPAHYRNNGRGSKGSDLEAIPLCRKHHDEQEAMRWPAFCRKHRLDRDELVADWNLLYTEWIIDKENNGKR